MTGQTRAATKMMPVTLRAMFQRLNRALAKERCIVKAPPGRSHGSAAETGTYYLLNLERNELVASKSDCRREAGQAGSREGSFGSVGGREVVNRADIMTKIEALISTATRAAWPGERDAARGRLAAIKSKYRRMSDAEISAAVEMLSAAVKQLTQKKEELHTSSRRRGSGRVSTRRASPVRARTSAPHSSPSNIRRRNGAPRPLPNRRR